PTEPPSRTPPLALESCSAAGRRRNRRLNPGTATTRGGYRMRTHELLPWNWRVKDDQRKAA
ncbi:hypothetical protein, partial [Sphingobium sp. D43FB]|uniref:hypothetical protein n=1 Tax=Sphingobium sp. D43FB TaxID=2017595 RepID=UPI001C3EF011